MNHQRDGETALGRGLRRVLPARFALLAALVAALVTAVVTRHAEAAPPARSAYGTEGQCDGHPALPGLRVAAGFCVGLAAQRLGTPRGVLPLPDGRLLVTDLGRWDAPSGRLLLLTPGPGGLSQRVLLTGLDRPHGLQRGPQGEVWIGEAGRISRLDLDAAPPRLQPVIVGLPTAGRHPLKHFVFGPDGALYLNRGAPSDHCEDARTELVGGRRGCREADGEQPEAAIWRYAPEGGRWVGRVHARGLRNSMALGFHPATGRLWQGENARDVLPDPVGASDRGPHDELNLIEPNAHFGWPYCHDDGVPDPAFGAVDCRRFTAPVRLLPPHSAPLGLAFYDAPSAPPAWRGALLLTLHGYRATGHRIVGYALDDAGRPAPRFTTLVDGWSARAGRQPLGAPTDIRVDARGRLWVTEDRNGTLLVIAPR